MQNIYRTAQGKQIDMDKLRNTNEHVIAVGNMKVNARGDQLGPGGEVAQSRNQTMDNHYKIYGTHSPSASAAAPTPAEPDSDPVVFPADIVEQDQLQDQTPAPTPEAPKSGLRGSLANSIAAPTTVTQELIKPPSKQNNDSGPSRI